ncbi:hypothetical protein I4U23_003118 [Adineta vaga]|nr:hypothetical protein I4U23_003118 [Adineta vaga]
MSVVIKKILLSLSLILLVSLFIGTQAADITSSDQLIKMKNPEEKSFETIHHMGKRRFLPTRRELEQYMNEDDESHLNMKRYFLKSKRYFLNSKRNDE